MNLNFFTLGFWPVGTTVSTHSPKTFVLGYKLNQGFTATPTAFGH